MLTDVTPGSTSDANANINNNWTLIEALVNGDLDTTNLDAAAGILPAQLVLAIREAAGLNDANIRRGKSIVATEESRTNVAYGALGSNWDRVQNVVVPTDGLLRITYRALVKSTVAAAGRAAIFIGANQLKSQAAGGVPVVQEAPTGGTADDYDWIRTIGTSGLVESAGVGQASSVTTGLPWEAIEVEVAAGTYDVSVQYKATSGTITAKERKLWVEAIGF